MAIVYRKNNISLFKQYFLLEIFLRRTPTTLLQCIDILELFKISLPCIMLLYFSNENVTFS